MAVIPTGSDPNFFKVITFPSDQGLVSKNWCFYRKIMLCNRCNIVLTLV